MQSDGWKPGQLLHLNRGLGRARATKHAALAAADERDGAGADERAHRARERAAKRAPRVAQRRLLLLLLFLLLLRVLLVLSERCVIDRGHGPVGLHQRAHGLCNVRRVAWRAAGAARRHRQRGLRQIVVIEDDLVQAAVDGSVGGRLEGGLQADGVLEQEGDLVLAHERGCRHQQAACVIAAVLRQNHHGAIFQRGDARLERLAAEDVAIALGGGRRIVRCNSLLLRHRRLWAAQGPLTVHPRGGAAAAAVLLSIGQPLRTRDWAQRGRRRAMRPGQTRCAGRIRLDAEQQTKQHLGCPRRPPEGGRRTGLEHEWRAPQVRGAVDDPPLALTSDDGPVGGKVLIAVSAADETDTDRTS